MLFAANLDGQECIKFAVTVLRHTQDAGLEPQIKPITLMAQIESVSRLIVRVLDRLTLSHLQADDQACSLEVLGVRNLIDLNVKGARHFHIWYVW